MTWFKVDDGLWGHPKWLATPPAARGLWATAGSWSADQLTDGFIPKHALATLGGRPKDAADLVKARLWVVEDGGWRFWQWSDDGRQPTRADVESERAKKAAAGRAGGRASGASRRGKSGSKPEAGASSKPEASASESVGDSLNPRPVPSRPDLTDSLTTLVVRRLFGDARASTTTTGLAPEQVEVWRQVAGAADLEVELRSFLIRNAVTELHDPGAALLGWLRRAADRAKTPGPKPVIGCEQCDRGWLSDDLETGLPVPCPTCKPHRYPKLEVI